MALRTAVAFVIVSIALQAAALGSSHTATSFAQPAALTFPATGQLVKGAFLAYWNGHGALDQQGYPISGEIQEISDVDGKNYTVQYFERSVFEMHPENAPPHNILLSLLGVSSYKERYPQDAPSQAPDTSPTSTGYRAAT